MTTIPFAQRLSCTIDQACQATGIGRTKLYEEMSAGRVRTTNVGKRRLVLVPSLCQLLEPAASDDLKAQLLAKETARKIGAVRTNLDAKPAGGEVLDADPRPATKRKKGAGAAS
jgi:hypothetical protein